ncbi:MAG TPA: MCP four helix bundle domain-containing protein, partial [Rhodoferax sp.]
MTISKRIIGGYAIVLALLALVVLISFVAISRIQTTYDRFLDVSEQLVNGSNELQYQLSDEVAAYRGILLFQEPDMQKKFDDQLQNNHRLFAEIIEKMRHLVPNADGLSILNEIMSIQQNIVTGQKRGIELARHGKLAEALVMTTTE